jgi:hypothetical protein
MPTLVLAPRQNDDARRMASAAREAGWEVYAATSWREFPERLRDADPVLYSDPLFADVAAGPLNIALLEPTANWLTTLPEPYLQRRVMFMTLAKARQLPGPIFLKPAEDKSFPARVYDEPESELPPPAALPPETLVLTSEPVVWETEYRCFIREQHIASMSVYMRFGELAQDMDGNWLSNEREQEKVARFVEAILADDAVDLPNAVVVDVGRIAGRGWAVIEANPAWASGIYGCTPDSVLPVLHAACPTKSETVPKDSRWNRRPCEIED